MATNSLPPIPRDQIAENYSWREWFNNLGTYIQKAQTGGVPWTVLQGGTGANNANDARVNLGLGTLATQNYNNVTITGGAIVYNTISNTPYGSFHDETTQTAAANTATTVTFNTTDFSNNIYVGSPTSRIYINNPGTYSLTFSVQGSNTGSAVDNITVWFRINGTDVPTSAGISAVPGKHGSTSGALVFGWTAFYSFNAGDYLEMVWTTDSGNSSLTTYAVGTSPIHPLSPSVALSLNFLTNL